MADLKISQLPVATTPLAGTEVLPIVQSGTTKQATITNVLASAATLAANTFSGAQNWATGTAIASASTINLDTATGNRVHITGTTTITAVTLTRGPRTLIFDGVLTLTHNATTNNLPGAVNITTAVGDRAIYESDGTTVYCVSYIPASGRAVINPVATATTAGLVPTPPNNTTTFLRGDATFAAVPAVSVGNSLVFVNSGQGTGTTATKIQRFITTTTSVGTAITYADSEANGGSFTINETGIYSMTLVMESGGTNTFGVSVNSNELTTNIQSINVANRLVVTTTSASGFLMSTSVTRRLVAGDVIRVHSNGNMANGNESTNFAIVKVGT